MSEKYLLTYDDCQYNNTIYRAIFELVPEKDFQSGEIAINKEIEFDLTINGKKVKFTKFLKIWEEAFDACVREEAHKLLKEKMGKITDLVYNLEQEVSHKLSEVIGYPSDK